MIKKNLAPSFVVAVAVVTEHSIPLLLPIAINDATPLVESVILPDRTSVINRTFDFWLLGGISLVVWFLCLLADRGKDFNPEILRQVSNLPFTFSTLALLCNYPHFMCSYRFTYGRNRQFVPRHWFATLAVPLLLGLLILASSAFSDTYSESFTWLARFNETTAQWPVSMHFGQYHSVGYDILGCLAWIMYATVGWHYSKQVFGCVMTYAHYDSWNIPKYLRICLRGNLLLLGSLNALYLACNFPGQGTIRNFSVLPVHFDNWILQTDFWLTGLSLIAFLLLLIRHGHVSRSWPSLTTLTPFIAFYIWWFPGIWPQPYAAIMVPFFHSLQYMPFAYCMLKGNSQGLSKKYKHGLSIQVAIILALGYFCFDAGPSALDGLLGSVDHYGFSFFIVAAALFLNIHHFFLDSVAWRQNQAPVRQALFE